MPTYLMLSILGPDGFATVSDHPSRIREVNHEVEAMGARVVTQYALLGQYDFATVIEAPDEQTMVRITTTLAARGTLKTHTLAAIPVEDYITALGDGVAPRVRPRGIRRAGLSRADRADRSRWLTVAARRRSPGGPRRGGLAVPAPDRGEESGAGPAISTTRCRACDPAGVERRARRTRWAARDRRTAGAPGSPRR